ncbi:MAG: 23S rRNA (pseudouridine(1915)-N(3))-methyltransferase RlmH, partial [Gemmatimonadota bacterium]
MRVRILCVGGVRGPLAPAVQEFESRAGRYWRLDVTEVEAGVKKGQKGEKEAVLQAEGERLRARVQDGRSEVVALTRTGKGMASRELAKLLEDCALRSVPEVCFLIGGAYGLSRDLLRGAPKQLSLSSLTLPHEMARLVLAEQLYRAGTILRNEPYHKGV